LRGSTLIGDLKKNKQLYGVCPSCGEEFRIGDATLFSIREKFPQQALEKIAELKQEISEQRAELKRKKHLITQRSQTTVESVNLGKILEKIVPSFSAFQYHTRDCRSLLEPIDYIIFSGLHQTGKVDSITFLDVKSGRAALTQKQKKIAELIRRGSVELDTISIKAMPLSSSSSEEAKNGK